MSDSDDSFIDCEETTTRVDQAIDKILSLKPVYIKSTNMSKSKNLQHYRQQLDRISTSVLKQRNSSRIDDKKKAEDMCREISNDITNLSAKLECFAGCLTGIFDKLEEQDFRLEAQDELQKKQEARIHNLENQVKECLNPPNTSYASRASCVPADNGRIEKLEYSSSEVERRKRNLELLITHPSLENTSENLENHVQLFLSSKLKLENRLIDANLKAYKTNRENCVKIVLSDLKFKRFLFTAKKKLREESIQETEGLYIGENLTSFNYEILKKLKLERTKRHGNNQQNFDTVYSFDGKVFVKIKRSDDRKSSIYIPNQASLLKFIDQLNENSRQEETR